MKKRINRMIVLISLLAIALTTILVTVIYYNLFRKQVTTDLKDYAVLLEEYIDEKSFRENDAGISEQKIRVTWIAEDGSVLYDSKADSAIMENHMNRPEVQCAFAEGEGQSLRKSQTFSDNTFYFARKLADDSVLRVARDAKSIYSVFASVLPSIFCVIALLAVLGFVAAHFLTKKLLAPIEQFAENLDENVELYEYRELVPFIDMIKEQHRDILKSAKMRQEFTANVSHELKTPLTAISGYAELIETGMAPEADVTRFAQGIHKSANRLLTLINDIIRLSELDSTEHEAPFENLNLYQMAETCVEMLTLSAEKHNVTISMTGSNCRIHGNKQMIEELLYNLCDNAIRYNNDGGRVDVIVAPAGKGGVLTVKDTGIGIPKEHQERIFERFYRVDKSRSKTTGGTGLGLAIVKHIVAKHDADLLLESDAGAGTEIKVVFKR